MSNGFSHIKAVDSAASNENIQTESLVNPRKMQKFVHIEEDGSEFICDLPTDTHFNDGSGALYWKNKAGMIPYDTYMAEKHLKEVKAEAEAIKASTAKKGDK